MKSCVTISLVEEARGGPFVLWDDLAGSVQYAAELGFDAVEIFPPGPDAIDPGSLRQLLDEHHLRLAAVGTGAGWVKHKLQVADHDPHVRKRAVQYVKGIIEFAGPFGASAIIGSMQGRSGGEVTAPAARDYLSAALEECGEAAKRFGVPLIYEPLNRYETNQCNRLEEGVTLLKSLGTDNVVLLADLFHMNIEEVDLGRALLGAGKYVGHIHFVDSNRRPVGNGHLDFAPVIAALRTNNYNGYLSAEAFAWPDSLAAARQTIRAYRYWCGDSTSGPS
jgi:sugar phosphate isomerase/epimerase